jgi:phosphoribosylanthranilate isomerase
MRVKICGFTNPEDARIACGLGADMIGVILVPKSVRCVMPERAREIFTAVEDAAKVAVLMPESPAELLEADRSLNPDYLQIHPTLPFQKLERVKGELNAKLILVIPVPTEGADREMLVEQAERAAGVADLLLVDTKGTRGGGTGLTHDWSISRAICESGSKPVLLAGGLNPSNVAEAVKLVRPYGVDVATGVEKAPGKKDPRLMKEFIRAAKEMVG